MVFRASWHKCFCATTNKGDFFRTPRSPMSMNCHPDSSCKRTGPCKLILRHCRQPPQVSYRPKDRNNSPKLYRYSCSVTGDVYGRCLRQGRGFSRDIAKPFWEVSRPPRGKEMLWLSCFQDTKRIWEGWRPLRNRSSSAFSVHPIILFSDGFRTVCKRILFSSLSN